MKTKIGNNMNSQKMKSPLGMKDPPKMKNKKHKNKKLMKFPQESNKNTTKGILKEGTAKSNLKSILKLDTPKSILKQKIGNLNEKGNMSGLKTKNEPHPKGNKKPKINMQKSPEQNIVKLDLFKKNDSQSPAKNRKNRKRNKKNKSNINVTTSSDSSINNANTSLNAPFRHSNEKPKSELSVKAKELSPSFNDNYPTDTVFINFPPGANDYKEVMKQIIQLSDQITGTRSLILKFSDPEDAAKKIPLLQKLKVDNQSIHVTEFKTEYDLLKRVAVMRGPNVDAEAVQELLGAQSFSQMMRGSKPFGVYVYAFDSEEKAKVADKKKVTLNGKEIEIKMYYKSRQNEGSGKEEAVKRKFEETGPGHGISSKKMKVTVEDEVEESDEEDEESEDDDDDDEEEGDSDPEMDEGGEEVNRGDDDEDDDDDQEEQDEEDEDDD